LQEVRVVIGDSADRLILEVGKLPKPKRRKCGYRQTINENHAGGIQESFGKVVWQTRKLE